MNSKRNHGTPVQQQITNFSNPINPLGALDWFIDNRIIGPKEWQPVFAEVEYMNLTEVMQIAAKARLSYLKTGRPTVTTGKIQTLPTMKGTRSRF